MSFIELIFFQKQDVSFTKKIFLIRFVLKMKLSFYFSVLLTIELSIGYELKL